MRKIILTIALLLLYSSIRSDSSHEPRQTAIQTVNSLNSSLDKLKYEIRYNNSRTIDTIVVRDIQEIK